MTEYILKVESEVSGQDGLLQQLHEVTVLTGGQVGEDVVPLGEKTKQKHTKCQRDDLGLKKKRKTLLSKVTNMNCPNVQMGLGHLDA